MLSLNTAQINVQTSDGHFLAADSLEMVEDHLDSLLTQKENLGTQYVIIDFTASNDLTLVYKESQLPIKIDTVFLTNDEIIQSVEKQILSTLLHTTPLIETEEQFNRIITAYPFLKTQSSIRYVRYSEMKVGAIALLHTNYDNSISGIAGAGRESESSWDITGQLDMHVENLWKTAGKVHLHWKRLNENTQTVQFMLEEPFIFGLPFGTRLDLRQDLRQGNYVSTDIGISALHTQPGLGTWRLGFESNTIYSTPKGDSLGISDLSSQKLALNSSSDRRNNRWAPTEGYFWNLSFGVGSQKQESEEGFIFQYKIVGGMYIPVTTGISLLSHVYGEGIYSKEVLHEGQKARYGGMQTLRGYNEDFYATDYVIIPSFECNYSLSTNIHLNIFSECAFQADITPIPMSYGIGYTQVTDQTVLSIQYGLSRGSKLSEGKIHLEITNRF